MIPYTYIAFLVYVFDKLSSVSPQYQIITEIRPVDAALTNVDEETDGNGKGNKRSLPLCETRLNEQRLKRH